MVEKADPIVEKAEILNATDSDWHEQQEFLEKIEVHVEQLCPQHAFKNR